MTPAGAAGVLLAALGLAVMFFGGRWRPPPVKLEMTKEERKELRRRAKEERRR